MKKPPSGNTGQTINLAELIDDMPEEVLITLHNLIVNRLNMLQRQRTRQSMEDFRPGDVVSFRAEDGQTVTGVLVRLNKKTVTVHTESGARWNVAPQLLTRIKRQLGSENLPDNTVEKSFIKVRRYKFGDKNDRPDSRTATISENSS